MNHLLSKLKLKKIKTFQTSKNNNMYHTSVKIFGSSSSNLSEEHFETFYTLNAVVAWENCF